MCVDIARNVTKRARNRIPFNVTLNAGVVFLAVPGNETGKPVQVSIPALDDVYGGLWLSKVDYANFGKGLLFFCKARSKGMPGLCGDGQ
jgi:hypothetical protein